MKKERERSPATALAPQSTLAVNRGGASELPRDVISSSSITRCAKGTGDTHYRTVTGEFRVTFLSHFALFCFFACFFDAANCNPLQPTRTRAPSCHQHDLHCKYSIGSNMFPPTIHFSQSPLFRTLHLPPCAAARGHSCGGPQQHDGRSLQCSRHAAHSGWVHPLPRLASVVLRGTFGLFLLRWPLPVRGLSIHWLHVLGSRGH